MFGKLASEASVQASPTSSSEESQYSTYDTPLTSPCDSPVKITQVDGVDDIDIAPHTSRARLGQPYQASDEDEVSASHRKDILESAVRVHGAFVPHSDHQRPDLTQPLLQTEQEATCTLHEICPEDATPLTRASPAAGSVAFPFPARNRPARAATHLARQRDPSALLCFCERNATPRQRRLMAGTLQTPDRFIPGRNTPPFKESVLVNEKLRQTGPGPRHVVANLPEDPFGSPLTRGPRVADRYATIRRSPAASNNFAAASTVGAQGLVESRRAASASDIWTVGRTQVTEGVASITNGRGGRVTSGTNAPHYTSDFLSRQSPSDEQLTHGGRLAIAMDVGSSSSMLAKNPSSTPLSASPSRRSFSDSGRKRTVWINGAWEREGSSHTRPPPKKHKEVPIIPFRVLNAPALRDDYYCSLLAYCHTLQCLAVGLGPHVYLWSEGRGKKPHSIPDSLTAAMRAHVTSLSFSSVEGGSAILAIGRADGRVTLWSPMDPDPRFDSEQPAPISCVCFRPTAVKRQSVKEPGATVMTEELLVGDELGNVYYYSVEWPNADQRDLFGWHGSMTLLARFTCHTQQVCGLAWSKDGEYFATGGNDNQLFAFETRRLFRRFKDTQADTKSAVNVRNGSKTGNPVLGQGKVLAIHSGQQKQLFTLNAAVKAISFAPWQSSLVAAGGGSNDRCIHFFHALSGATLATIDCHAQVTSLVWSEKRREIAATFGFTQPEHPYRVAVFSWPSCRRIVAIPWWSEERALYAIAYPGGPNHGPSPEKDVDGGEMSRTREEGCLVIATSDASIKFHEVWAERRGEKRSPKADVGWLGGSKILEDGVSQEIERSVTIR